MVCILVRQGPDGNTMPLKMTTPLTEEESREVSLVQQSIVNNAYREAGDKDGSVPPDVIIRKERRHRNNADLIGSFLRKQTKKITESNLGTLEHQKQIADVGSLVNGIEVAVPSSSQVVRALERLAHLYYCSITKNNSLPFTFSRIPV